MALDCYEYDGSNCCFECHRWPEGAEPYHVIERFSFYDPQGHLVALSCCLMEHRVRVAIERTSPFEKEGP
jgi:hypothetical protein